MGEQVGRENGDLNCRGAENKTGGRDTDGDLEDRDDRDRKTEMAGPTNQERGASVMLMLCTSGLIALDGR